MNPPGEQLVRDYLNRLSIAARGRLTLSDRRELLERTRARIEAEWGGLRDASAEQVRRALAALGDPIALVEKERARIDAIAAHTDAARQDAVHQNAASQDADRGARTGGLFGGRKNGVDGHGSPVWPVQEFPAPASAAPGASMPAVATPGASIPAAGPVVATPNTSSPHSVPLATAARGAMPVAVVQVNGGSSAANAEAVGSGNPPGSVSPAGSDGSSGTGAIERLQPVPVNSAVPAWPSESNGDARRVGQPGLRSAASTPGGQEADGTSGHSGDSPRPPLPRPAPPGDGGGTNRPPLAPGRPGRRAPDPESAPAPTPDAARADDDDHPGSGIEFDASVMEPYEEYDDGGGLGRLTSALRFIASALGAWLSRLGTELVAVVLRDRLEAIAIVLLGLGGAIYPPIWIIGVIFALCSRKWDHRDKWLGLALPVFLVVFGAMFVMVLGGERQTIGHYAMEFWVAASRLSRLAAVLGAGYLLSRAIKYQGKRIRREPPWTQRRPPR